MVQPELSSQATVATAFSRPCGSVVFGILVWIAMIQKTNLRTADLLFAGVSLILSARSGHCAVVMDLSSSAVGKIRRVCEIRSSLWGNFTAVSGAMSKLT